MYLNETQASITHSERTRVATAPGAPGRQLPDVEATLRGALHRQRRRCGNAGCHCAEGKQHGPYLYLSGRTGGRSRLVYVPTEVVDAVTRRVDATARIGAVLAEISAINLELLTRGELA